MHCNDPPCAAVCPVTPDISRGVAEGFDAIVCAGNVMAFLAPSTRTEVLRRLRGHLAAEDDDRPSGGNVVDLMSALKESLKKDGGKAKAKPASKPRAKPKSKSA